MENTRKAMVLRLSAVTFMCFAKKQQQQQVEPRSFAQ